MFVHILIGLVFFFLLFNDSFDCAAAAAGGAAAVAVVRSFVLFILFLFFVDGVDVATSHAHARQQQRHVEQANELDGIVRGARVSVHFA